MMNLDNSSQTNYNKAKETCNKPQSSRFLKKNENNSKG